ncbi:MAG: TlpA family protein disulfide reductase [Pirellulales bacterium]|nr:TlpA family protein disulfide reductase [Pirellulales bacterium]
MMTPQEAYKLFVYADHAMILVGLTALSTSIGLGIYAILPGTKGRRRRPLLMTLVSFLIFAMFWGTQASVLIAFFNPQWTPLQIVLFALPVVVMLAGLTTSIAYAVHAVLKRTGKQRRQTVSKSLLGVVVFTAGVAPHTAAMLIPVISAEDHTNRPGTLTHIGEPAPDFELSSIEAAPFQTVDLRGKVIVLNFFATWCGPCRMELPHLQTIWDEFQSNGDFQMLVIGREESDDSLKAFRQEHGYTFPMASDSNKTIYSKFASQSIPRTYLISRQGTIVYQWTGNYEEEISKLRKLLRKELAKKK